MNNLKKCFKCNLILPISDFYKHKGTADGYLNKCKNCTKNDTKSREEKLRKEPSWVEKERKRGREKYHRLNYKNKNKPTTEKKKEIIDRYFKKYPEKSFSHKYSYKFLKKNKGFHSHHWSYNEEHLLDVIELSVKDHHFLHRFIIYDQERMMYRNLDGLLLDSKEKHLEYFLFCKNNYQD